MPGGKYRLYASTTEMEGQAFELECNKLGSRLRRNMIPTDNLKFCPIAFKDFADTTRMQSLSTNPKNLVINSFMKAKMPFNGQTKSFHTIGSETQASRTGTNNPEVQEISEPDNIHIGYYSKDDRLPVFATWMMKNKIKRNQYRLFLPTADIDPEVFELYPQLDRFKKTITIATRDVDLLPIVFKGPATNAKCKTRFVRKFLKTRMANQKAISDYAEASEGHSNDFEDTETDTENLSRELPWNGPEIHIGFLKSNDQVPVYVYTEHTVKSTGNTGNVTHIIAKKAAGLVGEPVALGDVVLNAEFERGGRKATQMRLYYMMQRAEKPEGEPTNHT
jgi:hypothetical protein